LTILARIFSTFSVILFREGKCGLYLSFGCTLYASNIFSHVHLQISVREGNMKYVKHLSSITEIIRNVYR